MRRIQFFLSSAVIGILGVGAVRAGCTRGDQRHYHCESKPLARPLLSKQVRSMTHLYGNRVHQTFVGGRHNIPMQPPLLNKSMDKILHRLACERKKSDDQQ